MNKLFAILFVLCYQFGFSCSSLSEAKELALKKNKFVMVYFSASSNVWEERMSGEYDWLDNDKKFICENFVVYDIHKNQDRRTIKKYHITSLPMILFIDGNGMEIYRFSDYKDQTRLNKVLENLIIPTDFFGNDLVNFANNKEYNSAIRVAQKYYDFSLTVDSKFKTNIINVSNQYIALAEKKLSNKSQDFLEKEQKLNLFKLYSYAYLNDFETVSNNLALFSEDTISENNIDFYYFLKYLTSKALKKDNLPSLEQKVKAIDGFDYFIKKADLILALKA